MRRVLLALLVGTVGCKKPPEPTPTTLDDLLHFFLVEYEDAEDQVLIDGVINMEAWWRVNSVGGEAEGTITDLVGSEVERMGIDPNVDMEWLNSAMHFYEQDCTVAQLEELYSFHDQSVLFPDNYRSYRREYHDNFDCFETGSCEIASWDVFIESSFAGLLNATYELESGLRRVEGVDEDGEPWEAMFSRTYMPEPGVVGDGNSGAFFDQSYQIEVFLDTDAGKSIHLYGMWSSGGLRTLGNPDAAVWSNNYLQGLKDWDYRLDELCAAEDPFDPPE